ncbi:uncharacterized protein PY17X_1207800 [Plasmodium yoelii]|uniref:Heptatricopeptide repeat-containing protein n=3 Tax=Plasmodium yoelii TaxID=5861 RepID=A0AAE9WZ00_PLAYO|nr:uncharacterized protein PY17X_1207800 [Plasmodium yoelii]WBY59057.1 heptatricopeptide repeat-containing protein [Plasmodium yoelii yoelii]VTZ79879.1 heptatricopeptide repeat-containing protein, putative [Plasmodium yoelii]|eukprot:XP_731143.2 uncharacterized protein PY17X_1207800 [Plasmodium yoelii]
MIKQVTKNNTIFLWCFKRYFYIPNKNDIGKLSIKNLGKYSLDIIRLSKSNNDIYEIFKTRVNSEITLLDGKDCYRIIKSLEINNKLDEKEEFIKNLLNKISIESCKYSIKEICDICFLCSKLNLLFIPLFASLSLAFLNKINLATPENISTICLSFCKVQIKDINLFNRISVATLNILHMFDIESLINVLISFSYLNIKKEMLLYSSVNIFVKNQNNLDINHLIKIAYIYSKFSFINNDINTILQKKLPLHISELTNIQLADLIISLHKLYINTYDINKYFTDVNFLQLEFPIAIKVINILSQIKNINIEFKYDEIILFVNNFLRTNTRRELLEVESNKQDDGDISLVEYVDKNKFCETDRHKNEETKIKEELFLSNVNNDDNEMYRSDVEQKLEQNDAPFLEIIKRNEYPNDYYIKNGLFNFRLLNEENEIYNNYSNIDLRTKLNTNSICYLCVDIFESLCNFLVKNSINDEYEKKFKFYLNYICKEIVRLKDYINFTCLIKLFSSLLKIPIIWGLPFLQLNDITLFKENFLFYIDKETNFYVELINRYFKIFHTSEDVDNHSVILSSMINLFKLKDSVLIVKGNKIIDQNEGEKYTDLLEKCLNHYSSIIKKGKKYNEKKNSYIMEEYIIYNFIDYNYKNVQLWNRSLDDKNGISNQDVEKYEECNNSYNSYNEDNINLPYALKPTIMVNKILALELFSIVQSFTKNLKMNFKDGMYYIPLLEYDNYIAYIFLGPENYFYSSNEQKELNLINTALERNNNVVSNDVNNDEKKQHDIFLINDISYNPYDIFYNEKYFAKTEILIKINYLLTKGYNIIAIPFYSWRWMNSEEKFDAINVQRNNIMNAQ